MIAGELLSTSSTSNSYLTPCAIMYLTPRFAGVLSLVFLTSTTAADLDSAAFHLVRRDLAPSTEVATPLRFTSKYANLTRIKASGPGSHVSAAKRLGYGSGKARDVYYDYERAAKISLGDQSFWFLMDTGNSDTWIAQDGYQCVNYTGGLEPDSYCNIGPGFIGKFSGGQIADVCY